MAKPEYPLVQESDEERKLIAIDSQVREKYTAVLRAIHHLTDYNIWFVRQMQKRLRRDEVWSELMKSLRRFRLAMGSTSIPPTEWREFLCDVDDLLAKVDAFEDPPTAEEKE